MKLIVQLVPSTSWYVNLRAILKPSIWKKVGLAIHNHNKHTCAYCGRGKGEYTRLDAHEEWLFEREGEERYQRLRRIVSVCSMCHLVVHYENSSCNLNIPTTRLNNWACKVNGCTQSEWFEHLEKARERFLKRSHWDWAFDVAQASKVLNENLAGRGLVINTTIKDTV